MWLYLRNPSRTCPLLENCYISAKMCRLSNKSSAYRSSTIVMAVRQRGQPRLCSWTALAHDAPKGWWRKVLARSVRHALQRVIDCGSWHGRWRAGVVTGVASSRLWCAYLFAVHEHCSQTVRPIRCSLHYWYLIVRVIRTIESNNTPGCF